MRTYAHDGLVFDVKDEGPEDGYPVVFLHGFPQDSTAWDSVVEPIQEQGYRTLAPNLRGYSPAARPTAAKDYVSARTAADAIALLDAIEADDAHIVGHDWGGFVAWAVASEYPDRVRTVSVLSTPHPAAMKHAMITSTQGLRSWYMGMFQLPWISERILDPDGPAWRALMRGLPPHQAAHYTDRMRQPGALSAALNWYRAMPRDMIRPSLKMHRITVPTAYIWGERDPALGRAGAEATADYVTGDYIFTQLQGIGHWIPETAPDAVVEGLLDRFSDRVP
ncbi:MAG: alpha/beta hydrolase [Candidatus Nanopelagicales bacterium]